MMNRLILEQEQVSCFCFTQNQQPDRAGLKPVSITHSQKTKTNLSSGSKSIDRYKSKLSIGQLKTSLRRRKPNTPYERGPKVDKQADGRMMRGFENGCHFQKEKVQRKLEWKELLQEKLQHPIEQPNLFHQGQKQINFQNKESVKHFHICQPPRNEKNHFSLRNNQASTRSQQASPKQYHKVIEQNDLQLPAPFTKLGLAQGHKSDVFKGDGGESSIHSNIAGVANFSQRKEHFRVQLRQIQSVMDENEINSDEMSEVIGRGWENDQLLQEDQQQAKYILKAETIVTMASNVKNSETLTSGFGARESHFGRS